MKKSQKVKIEFEHVAGKKFPKLMKSKTRKQAAAKIVHDHESELGKQYYPALVKMENSLKRKQR